MNINLQNSLVENNSPSTQALNIEKKVCNMNEFEWQQNVHIATCASGAGNPVNPG